MITTTIRPHIDYLKLFQGLLGRYDFISAKALFARSQSAIAPELVEEKRIEFIEGFHLCP